MLKGKKRRKTLVSWRKEREERGGLAYNKRRDPRSSNAYRKTGVEALVSTWGEPGRIIRGKGEGGFGNLGELTRRRRAMWGKKNGETRRKKRKEPVCGGKGGGPKKKGTLSTSSSTRLPQRRGGNANRPRWNTAG